MHEVAQLIITNNSHIEFLNLRNKNILLTIIINVTNYANDDENNFRYTSTSQLENQELLSNININFNYTIDENNDILNNFTSQNGNLRFENLTSI